MYCLDNFHVFWRWYEFWVNIVSFVLRRYFSLILIVIQVIYIYWTILHRFLYVIFGCCEVSSKLYSLTEEKRLRCSKNVIHNKLLFLNRKHIYFWINCSIVVSCLPTHATDAWTPLLFRNDLSIDYQRICIRCIVPLQRPKTQRILIRWYKS